MEASKPALLAERVGGLPVIVVPTDVDFAIYAFDTPDPQHSGRCFTHPIETRYRDRDCVIEFLYTTERFLLSKIPNYIDEKTVDEKAQTQASIVREVLRDNVGRVAKRQLNKPLPLSFIDEVLVSMELLTDKAGMFEGLYRIFLQKGGQAEAIMTQMSFDTESPSGLPEYSTGELAPTFGDEIVTGEMDRPTATADDDEKQPECKEIKPPQRPLPVLQKFESKHITRK